MSSYSPLVSKIYKSRNIILQLLEKRGFNVDDYTDFSINEVHIMYNNKQLDMLLENPNTKKKIYIKYHLATRLGNSHLYDYIDDLFDIEDILSNDDDLIIVSKDKMNNTMRNLLEEIYIKDKKFVTIYNLHDYLFNILNHDMIPEHTILSKEETEAVIKKYNINKMSEFPEISRFDKVAMAIGLRPSHICKIVRSSPTSITGVYYRMCY